MYDDRKKRIFAVLLIMAVCFAMLFSVCFVAVSYHHDCSGDGCSVCMQISACENILKLLCGFSLALLAVFAFSLISCGLSSVDSELRFFVTPVSLRVKLSD